MSAFLNKCRQFVTMAKTKKLTQEERLQELFKKKPLLRSRDIYAAGISPTTLLRLFRKNKILSSGRGILYLPGSITSEHRTLMEIGLRVPKGVICLLSALRFHDIGSQNPQQVWLAIDRKARKPRIRNIQLKIVRFSTASLLYGVEKHKIHGVPVPVTKPAKSVADCFKYRNKIGLDVALEALKEGWREKRFTMDELHRAAKVCRVLNVIRPYVETLI
jgi:predicted transcriptional regulator of viral defense system